MQTTQLSLSPADEVAESQAQEIARLFPRNGQCTEQEYLAVDTNLLVEFSDGNIEVLPMPTDKHQAMAAYLFEALLMFVRSAKLGTVRFAALKVKLRSGKYREPDVLFLKKENDARRQNAFWLAADLVMEVVSEDNRSHDLVTKRQEYAAAGIGEYWIVDPKLNEITVLKLDGDRYQAAGVYSTGEQAASVLLPGFSLDVAAVFAAE